MQLEVKDIQRVNEAYGRRETATMPKLGRRPVLDLLADAPPTDRPRLELYTFLAETIEGLFVDIPEATSMEPSTYLDHDTLGQVDARIDRLHEQVGRLLGLRMHELRMSGNASPNATHHIKNIAGGNYEGSQHVHKIFAAISAYQAQTGVLLPPEAFERLAKQGKRPIFAWTALHFVPNHTLDLALAANINPYQLEGDLSHPDQLRLGVKEEIFNTLLDLGELWREPEFPLQRGIDRLLETWVAEFPEHELTGADLKSQSRTFLTATRGRYASLFEVDLEQAEVERASVDMAYAVLEDLPVEAMGAKQKALHFAFKGATDLARYQHDQRQLETIGCPARFSGALGKWYDYYEASLSKWYRASYERTTR